MYLDHFKLGCRPFNITPAPAFFCLTTPVQQTCDHIHDAIQRQSPVLLLSGEPGTGKTALLKHLQAKGNNGTNHWVFIDRAQLHADDLLMLIGESLGISVKGSFNDECSEQIRNRMRELVGEGASPVIILDEADHLAYETLEELLNWHASIRIQGVSSTLILAGLPQLAQKIEDRDHVLFAPPWGDHFILKKFDFREMHTVITHCLKIAAYDGPPLFDNEALKSIFALSEGVPRVIMHICDLCLFCATSMQRQKVTREIVEEVSRFILLDEDTSIQFGVDSETITESVTNSLPKNRANSYSSRSVNSFQRLAIGFLVIFGAVGIGMMWPSQSPETGNNRSLRVAGSPADSTGWSERTASTSSELIHKAESLSSARTDSSKRNSSTIDTVDDTSRFVMVAEQAKPPPLQLDGDYSIPPEGNSQKTENLIENGQYPSMNQVSTVFPAENVTVLDPQPNPVFGESDGSKLNETVENGFSTVLSTESHQVVEPLQVDLVSKNPLRPSQTEDESPLSIIHNDEPRVTMLPVNPMKEKVHVVSSQTRKPVSPLRQATIAALEVKTPKRPISKKSDRKRARNAIGSNGTDLIKAVVKGDRRAIRNLLDKGVSIDSVSNNGETALMKAAWAGRSDLMNFIISQKPSINKQNKEGWSALFYAAVRGHYRIVSSLLAHGAEVDLADQDGRTPLMAAAWNGHARVVELLLNQGVNPNRKNRDGWSPLMFTALKGHIEVARLLIHHGADISLISHDGETSAELAAQQGHAQFVSLLAKE
ncbi:MAG: ankyrin repeat domain-containing protein [Candidatus Thiodiazotropha sp. (ex Codakia rugifera)]|nr:ankyrin repeat domain-containing protein [Candidatus Thiodiazotropha sp. (ex Codakia rugifera)]